MNREFLLNLLFLLFINVLIKPFYILGIDRTVQNRVGLEDYGLYATLFSFTFLLQIINDFGLQNFNNRNISQHRQLLPKYFPNMLVLKLGLGLIYTALTLMAALVLGYSADYFPLLLFFILNQILLSAILFFRSNISGLGFYRTDSWLTIMDRGLLIVLVGFLLWGNWTTQPFQIEWFVYAQTTSLLLTATVAFFIIYRQLPRLTVQFRPAFLLLILKKSYPYALAIFLMTVYTRIDFVMIERLHPTGEKEAGIYAAAYRLLDALNVIGLLFAGLLLPMAARLLKEKQSIRPLLKLSLPMILCGAITVVIATIFYRKELLFLLYDDASNYGANVLGVLIVNFILISGGYIYGSLLTANDSLEKMNQLFALSVGLNVGLNFWLIPQYGALAAAATTVTTQTFALIGQIILAKREFQLRNDIGLIARLVLLGCILVTLGIYLKMSFGTSWVVGFGILLILGIGLGFLLRLLDVAAFIQLTKSER
ncbi:MAG: oligosaccharide flippase family protein [Bacteroidota bacterium]